VLNLHSSVRETVVVVQKDTSEDDRLVAYVTPASTSPILINELRSLLKQRLPAWMIPSTFLTLDKFPRTANGKLDRKSLPIPEAGSSENHNEYIAPRTPIEEALSDIWCEVLGLKQVGVRDNFFELGGHSLPAMRVVSRISKLFAVDLSLRNF